MTLSEEERKARARERSSQWRKANPDRHRENCRRWCDANAEHHRKQSRQWSESNPGRVRENRRRYNTANPERARVQSRQWRETNPERARENRRRWRESNPERWQISARVRDQIRRARKSNAIDPCRPVTAAGITRRILLFGMSCAYCGNQGPFHIDHVEPLALGGLHVPDNLVPACERCNCSKGDTPVEAWYLSQPFFSSERWEALQAHTGRQWSNAQQLTFLSLL